MNFPCSLYKKEIDSKLYSGHYINYFFSDYLPDTKVLKQSGSYYPSGRPMYADKCIEVRIQTAKKQIEKYLQQGWIEEK
tara:strand:+ start:176 stop:412 length:237 start_codon:yes stop_codon:yes gene_type:complete